MPRPPDMKSQKTYCQFLSFGYCLTVLGDTKGGGLLSAYGKWRDSMAKQKNDIAKLSNAFSTGGGGSFERRIQAVFLLALLVDGVSPILNTPIERIAFQAKHLCYAVDDMVVFSASGAKLLCQMKHSLSVTEKDTT